MGKAGCWRGRPGRGCGAWARA